MQNMVAAAGYTEKRRLKVNAAAIQTSEVFTGSGLDDLTPAGTFTGIRSHLYKVIVTTAAGTDKYDWYRDGVLQAASVAMAGGAVSLDNGVTITFAASTGHTLADFWEFEATITTDRHKISAPNVTTLRLSLDYKVWYKWVVSTSEPSANPITTSAVVNTALIQSSILPAGNGMSMRVPWGLVPMAVGGTVQPDLYLWIQKHTSDAQMQIAEL
ncbi:hypothetical protein LCGC14_0601990 [marine sediment metagenome]|uniref:Uncharacterized protein n=1 Tax=marine sediment metagenome TaxID=412755 RepID=A0A0F9RUD2_9ZZZZ